MKKFVSISLVALALTAGCRDEQGQPNATPATVAERITAPSYSASGAAPRSTVCVAFDNELARLQAELAENPGNAELERRVASAQSIITDSCE